MALSRLGNRSRGGGDFTWPGFVDVMASLLMVFVFVLMVFVLIQANLAYRLSGQDASLSALRRELSMLGELLSLERDASVALSADLSRTQAQLASTQNELLTTRQELDRATAENSTLSQQIASITVQLGLSQDKSQTLEQQAEQLNQSLQASRAEADALRQETSRLSRTLTATSDQLVAAQAQLETQKNRLSSLDSQLAESRQTLTSTQDQLASEKQLSADAKREIDELTLAMSALQGELNRLRGLLDDKRRESVRDKIAIANLGKELNNALANKVEELRRFRSEFFGRLREVLENRNDVQVVGDRFVFQSEVLFSPGQASIGPAGQEQLGQIAAALIDIVEKIPQDIPWVLQVDGHTDNIPVSGVYADNWDLSTERALSVVRFMVQRGVPPERLAAAGYGEFQPVSLGDTDADRQKNRRIELKLTQRITTE